MKSKFLIPLALFLGINANAQRFTDNDVEKVCKYIEDNKDSHRRYNSRDEYYSYYGKNNGKEVCTLFEIYMRDLKKQRFLNTFIANFGKPDWEGSIYPEKTDKRYRWDSENYSLILVFIPYSLSGKVEVVDRHYEYKQTRPDKL